MLLRHLTEREERQSPFWHSLSGAVFAEGPSRCRAVLSCPGLDLAPTGTPRRIVEQLHGDIVRGLRKTALREQFLRQGAESTPEGTPDGFMRLMQEEYLRYHALIRVGGIRPE